MATKAVRRRDGIGGQRRRRAEGPPDGTQTKENLADMRAGRVYNVTAQRGVCKGTGGKGAAVTPVSWTGASGTGHTES